MKKATSVLLAILMVFSVFFAVSSSAAETPKSQAFLESLVKEKSITVNLDDSAFSGIPIVTVKNVSLSAQFTKNGAEQYDVKVGGKAKINGFNGKIVGDNDKLDVYFLFFKVNLAEVIGNFNLADMFRDMAPVLDKLDQSKLAYLTYATSFEEQNRMYGKVTVEQLVPNIQAIATDFAKDTGEDLNGKSDEEIVSIVLNCDEEAAKKYADLLTMHIEFIYADGNLVDLRVQAMNPDTKVYEKQFDLAEQLGFKFKSIQSPADASAFKGQFFAIDLTKFIKSIMR